MGEKLGEKHTQQMEGWYHYPTTKGLSSIFKYRRLASSLSTALPSKVLEGIVYNQPVYYFESYGLLFQNQHGFRRNKSTSNSIFEFDRFHSNGYQKWDIRNYKEMSSFMHLHQHNT